MSIRLIQVAYVSRNYDGSHNDKSLNLHSILIQNLYKRLKTGTDKTFDPAIITLSFIFYSSIVAKVDI